MQYLEEVSDVYNGCFVDLFVRKSNKLAQQMYNRLGYIIYREVLNYYSGEENAYDMRKSLRRDPDKESMIPLPHPITADQLEW